MTVLQYSGMAGWTGAIAAGAFGSPLSAIRRTPLETGPAGEICVVSSTDGAYGTAPARRRLGTHG